MIARAEFAIQELSPERGWDASAERRISAARFGRASCKAVTGSLAFVNDPDVVGVGVRCRPADHVAGIPGGIATDVLHRGVQYAADRFSTVECHVRRQEQVGPLIQQRRADLAQPALVFDDIERRAAQVARVEGIQQRGSGSFDFLRAAWVR